MIDNYKSGIYIAERIFVSEFRAIFEPSNSVKCINK